VVRSPRRTSCPECGEPVFAYPGGMTCRNGHGGLVERDEADDAVNHPSHYNKNPSGVECIEVIRHLPCNLANAVKYAWRAGEKGDAVEDLKKCLWYLNDERVRVGMLRAQEFFGWSWSTDADSHAKKVREPYVLADLLIYVSAMMTIASCNKSELLSAYDACIGLACKMVEREIAVRETT
jgi:Protein of unknwon function (DUF3310)